MLVNLKNLPDGHVIRNRYVVLAKLAQGGSGTVYRVEDKKDGEKKALKALRIDREGSQEFRNEICILRKLTNVSGVPTLHAEFTDPEMHVMVTDLYVSDLSKLVQNSPAKKLDTTTVLNLGFYIFHILEQVHHHDIIHRDVKANNFCLKFHHQHQEVPIVLIDYGQSNSVKESTDCKDIKIRTHAYATPSMASGNPCSKKDDVIMALYMLLEMLGENVFSMFHGGGTKAEIMEKKTRFEQKPMDVQPYRWVAEMMAEIKPKHKNQQQNFTRLRSIIRNAKRGVQADRHTIELKKTADGKFYL